MSFNISLERNKELIDNKKRGEVLLSVDCFIYIISFFFGESTHSSAIPKATIKNYESPAYFLLVYFKNFNKAKRRRMHHPKHLISIIESLSFSSHYSSPILDTNTKLQSFFKTEKHCSHLHNSIFLFFFHYPHE